jgi:hypothetical protein
VYVPKRARLNPIGPQLARVAELRLLVVSDDYPRIRVILPQQCDEFKYLHSSTPPISFSFFIIKSRAA